MIPGILNGVEPSFRAPVARGHPGGRNRSRRRRRAAGARGRRAARPRPVRADPVRVALVGGARSRRRSGGRPRGARRCRRRVPRPAPPRRLRRRRLASAVLLLRGGGVDVLHAHKFGSNVWAAILGTLARTPAIVAHEHTWSFEGQRLRRVPRSPVDRARADAFLAVSREDRRRMIEIEGIDPDKLIFVPNGIPPPPAPERRRHRGPSSGSPPTRPSSGPCARCGRRRRWRCCSRPSATLARRFPALRVLIVGEGPSAPASSDGSASSASPAP